MDKEIIHDFFNYNAHINSREMFLNNFHSESDQNPGVEYRMSNAFIKGLRSLDLKSPEAITIHMHSVGGCWADGMAIFDAISMSRCYITMVAYGQAESMSGIILQAADNRLITKNTYFMSHYGSTEIADGHYLNVQNWVKYEKHLCDMMLDIYASRCVNGAFFKEKYGKSPPISKVKNFLNTKLKSGDWYLSAEEAVHYGFADEVIDSWQKLQA